MTVTSPSAASDSTSAEDCAPTEDCAGALSGDLGWALGKVFRSYIKTANDVIDGMVGGARGYQILTTAARALPATQLAIAQRLGIDRTVMTYLLDDLEDAGLIERRPDPADRRARRIVATEKGQETLVELTQRLRCVEDHLLSALDECERGVFRDLLRRLASHADSLDPVTNPCKAAEEVGVSVDAGRGTSMPRPRRSAASR
ncbi:MarR family winged helix-turn-helix transcriptional regulator [Planotetraspora sp. A-T 1434]|uniref:MarR family winged helix-turn-helix transcriptional regulator n=1 Tax=Planotetraspora sp. A-T 1434 TaxID=2979219 RepID=UPI0021BE5BE2|nr:MarR family winged helix-turn-helix transcriptional regulator [Planotetraspora sp. A-T 1434]MCT9932352.1 MarR family winged helix-turn-helix transcriptional regulator [Planotetraspora sp. A-T 1434]